MTDALRTPETAATGTTTISAWIYDPTQSFFKDKNGHAALYKIACQNPNGCDLFTKSDTCLLTGAMSSCKFGRKTSVQGPTKKARTFFSWMNEKKKENAEFIGKLKGNKAYNRIARINGYYYLPYPYMAKSFLGEENPLLSEWVPEDEMTADLLERICNGRPRSMMGGVIEDYQKQQVPKFLSDLRMFFPEIFALLSEGNKKRAEVVSGVGRTADLLTCLPGEYAFTNSKWNWDGKTLTGHSMLFQPVKGDIRITIVPERGQPVKITDDCQIGPETVFLD
jgi:hypothetical protein